MRIDQIELTNFRNYEALALDFTEGRTLLIGPNGAGKSSLVDAISWCLTGHCRGVNLKGEGQKDLIRNGADQATVALHIAGLPAITRSISRAGGVSASLKPEAILGQLKTTDGMLQAVLYSQAFFDLHHAEAKSLLMAALDIQITRASLPGIDLPANMKAVGLDYLDALYKQAFDRRTDVKRALAAMRVPEKPKVVQIESAGKTVEDLKATLTFRQDKLQRLTRKQSAAEQAQQTSEREIQHAETQAVSIDTQMGALSAHEGMLQAEFVKLENAKSALAVAEHSRAEPLDTLHASIREAEILIDKLGRHDPDRGCVLSATIPCLTKATEFAGQVETLRKQTSDLGERLRAGQARQAAIASAQQSVRDAERDVAYHQSQMVEIGVGLTAARSCAEQLKTLKAGLPELKKTAKAAAQAVLHEREAVDRLVGEVTTTAAYTTALAAYNRGVTERAELEAAVEQAEAQVKLLGPGGVRTTALSAGLDAFESIINAALVAFGFQVAIQADPWQVLVERDDIDGAIRFEMLSKGQRLWTGLAFQLALATVSGLGFCVIDDAEAVVGQHRAMMTSAVMLSDLGQVIVAMAKAENEPVPTIDGLQVVRVVDRQPATV